MRQCVSFLVVVLSLLRVEAGKEMKCEEKECAPLGDCEDELTVGHEIVQHKVLDTAKFWTFVDVTPFEKDGVLTSLELFAGMDNRPLSIGIFRPTSDNPCDFIVIDQIEFSSFKKGKNKIALEGDKALTVYAGDHMGFTWKDYGVVSFDYTSVNGDYCESNILPKTGDRIELHLEGHGNRDYAIRVNYKPSCEVDECGELTLGHRVVMHSRLDTAKYWTYVDVNPFERSGVVDSMELFAGHESRALQIGVFRPISENPCDFELIQKVQFDKFDKGYNLISLTGDNSLRVQAGDHYGFTWLDYGVISFDVTFAKGSYCENNIKPSVGDTMKMQLNRFSNRDYAINFYYYPDCDEEGNPIEAAPAEERMCKECFCVSSETGEEVKGTRAEGDVEC